MAFKRSHFGGGSSAGKVFIGGLAKETTLDTFVNYFGNYGEITDSVIMKDRHTGRPRGFGFITYADPSVVDTIIAESHIINGKQVEIKRTFPKGADDSKDFKTKKIFVGGIPITTSENEFKGFFSKYGKVVEHSIILDHETKRSRGFGFIVFDQEQVVDSLLSLGNKIDMVGTQVEIKKAEPKKLSNPTPALACPSESRGHNYSDRNFTNAGFAPTTYRSLGPGLVGRFDNYTGRFADYYSGECCFQGYDPLFGPYRGGFDREYSVGRGAYGRDGVSGSSGGVGSGVVCYPGPGVHYNDGAGSQHGGRTGYSNSIRYHPYC